MAADLLDDYDTLARSLLSGRGLGALITALHHVIGASTMVRDPYGRVLATAPAGATWPTVPAGLPVSVEDTVVAYLCCGRPRRAADVVPYAVSLVGLELRRRQAELAGQRRLAGQVLEDLLRGTIGAPEAERRLVAVGIRPDDDHALLVATVDDADGLASSPPLTGATTAVLNNCLVAVLEPGRSARAAGAELVACLGRPGDDVRVGVGGWYPGLNGLRRSYHEAYEAMTRGPGLNERAPSLAGLLLAGDDATLRDLARDVLRPLRDFDATHAGSLIATLRAYLDADGSVATVAARLIVHRNTVRYRVDQIERLTGRSLARTADRVQLWLALAAAHLDH